MRTPTWVRAALSRPCFTGVSRQHLGDLIIELAGAGPRHRLALCDRVLATLICLRTQVPHQALGVLFGVDRGLVIRATRAR